MTLARIIPAIIATRPVAALDAVKIGSYTMSADQTGISSTETVVLFDTKITTGIYTDLGTTDSSGTITIPTAAQTGFSFFRVTAYIWATSDDAYNNNKIFANYLSGGGNMVVGQVNTRNAFDGANFRTTVRSDWLPFGEVSEPTVHVKNRAGGPHSVLASGTAGHAVSRLTLEFI